MITPEATTHPGPEPVDADTVARVRAAQDTTGVAGTDTEILPAAAASTGQQYPTRSDDITPADELREPDQLRTRQHP